MSLDKSRICIIGAGAIGGVTSAILTREGYDVSLVCKHATLAEKINVTGLKVSGFRGEFIQKIPAVATPSELEGSFDFILIATKADALQSVAREMLPFSTGMTRFVSMQNGICEGMLAEVVGEERTIGCVVGWGGTMHEPGNVEMTSDGEFILGNWNRGPDDSLRVLEGVLSNVVSTRISVNILSDLYSKLIINSCITTLGAVSGQYLGEMLASRKVRMLFISIIREAIEVADAMELKVSPGAGGKMDYYKFLSQGAFAGLKRHLMIRVIGLKYRKLKSSSLQSLERGRKTEVANYNGYITVQGKKQGVSTPVNEKLTRIVEEIEQGKRKITPLNFKEF